MHGSGIVIGAGTIIRSGTQIFHQVTCGLKKYGKDDGFPIIGQNCILGAGAKILGKIKIGDDCIIGANVVPTKDIPPNSIVTTSAKLVIEEKK